MKKQIDLKEKKLRIIQQAQEVGRDIRHLLELLEDYENENPHDYIGASEFFCKLYPFSEDLNEYPFTISNWCESMHEQLETVYIVEECQFPLDENPDWYECRVFTDKSSAEQFAQIHYDCVTDFSGKPNICTCDQCAEGWKVSPDWWKSYTVRTTKKVTKKKN